MQETHSPMMPTHYDSELNPKQQHPNIIPMDPASIFPGQILSLPDGTYDNPLLIISHNRTTSK